jgi:hypothetical protein
MHSLTLSPLCSVFYRNASTSCLRVMPSGSPGRGLNVTGK